MTRRVPRRIAKKRRKRCEARWVARLGYVAEAAVAFMILREDEDARWRDAVAAHSLTLSADELRRRGWYPNRADAEARDKPAVIEDWT